jgi:ribonuclease HII
VVAAAVMAEPSYLEHEQEGLLRGLTDSKKLSESKREHFYEILCESSHVHVATGLAEVHEIDEINILQATHRAMVRALNALQPAPEFALIDGRKVPSLPCPSVAIPHGDSLSLSIAAASVVAKVTRDRMMMDLDELYPVYQFAKHKGYGTKVHLEALKQHGPCPIHRRSFRPVKECEETLRHGKP